jgi:uncharacterized iron-regulated membrane protein
MKHVSFVLMMLIAVTGTAAGFNQLIDSFKKPVTVPQPATPQAPKLPAPQQPVKK